MRPNTQCLAVPLFKLPLNLRVALRDALQWTLRFNLVNLPIGRHKEWTDIWVKLWIMNSYFYRYGGRISFCLHCSTSGTLVQIKWKKWASIQMYTFTCICLFFFFLMIWPHVFFRTYWFGNGTCIAHQLSDYTQPDTALPEKMTIKPSLKKQNKVKPVQEAQVNFQLQITSRKWSSWSSALGRRLKMMSLRM